MFKCLSFPHFSSAALKLNSLHRFADQKIKFVFRYSLLTTCAETRHSTDTVIHAVKRFDAERP